MSLYSGAIPLDPERALGKARDIMYAKNVRILRKPSPTTQMNRWPFGAAITKWLEMTTQLPWCTLEESDWDEKKPPEQAATLWHELVHVYQARGLGALKFMARYADPFWRWAYEMQAYRQTVRCMLTIGYRPDQVEEVVDGVSQRLRGTYALKRLGPNGTVYRESVAILRPELKYKPPAFEALSYN